MGRFNTLLSELSDNLVLNMNGSEFLASLARKSIDFSIEDILTEIQSKYDLKKMVDRKEYSDEQYYGIYLYQEKKIPNIYTLTLKDKGVHFIETHHETLEEACVEKIKLWAYSSGVVLKNK